MKTTNAANINNGVDADIIYAPKMMRKGYLACIVKFVNL
jgi:hypothetical protein